MSHIPFQEVIMIVTWALITILGISGAIFIGYGLKLQLVVHKSAEMEKLESYLATVKSKLHDRQQIRDKIVKQKEQFLSSHGEKTPTCEDEEVGWCAEDYDWRIDDLNWTIDDLQWDIRNTNFEKDSRQNVESTSKATFWTVLGAAIFSLAGFVLGIITLI
jgi:hypothetical protein